MEKAKDQVRRTKVTLVLNVDDVHKVYGQDVPFNLTYARHRIEAGSKMVGMTFYTAYIGPVGTMLALSLIDKEFAAPGTQVTLVVGEHPGAGTDPDAELGFHRIRATVQVAPFNEHARQQYRQNL